LSVPIHFDRCKLQPKPTIVFECLGIHYAIFLCRYYMFNTGGEEWEVRMGWRKRLVEWLRNLSMHFTLPPPVLADAVALADRFAVQYAEKMGRTQLQLLYLTALSIAARVHRIPQDVIMTIRGLAPDYDQRDYLAMESHMVQIMGTTADRKSDPFPSPLPPGNVRSTGSDTSSAPEDKTTAETAETGPTRTTRLARTSNTTAHSRAVDYKLII
jgi:hypothetical protein